MITIFCSDDNNITEENYEKVVHALPLHQVSCTCGKCGTLIRYGRYKRTFRVRSHRITLNIQRVFCKECHLTHAILLSSMVPYSQIPMEDQRKIILSYETDHTFLPVLEENYIIDDREAYRVIRNYRKHWKARLEAEGVSLEEDLVTACFRYYGRQFMQIKKSANRLFVPPT